MRKKKQRRTGDFKKIYKKASRLMVGVCRVLSRWSLGRRSLWSLARGCRGRWVVVVAVVVLSKWSLVRGRPGR